MSYVMSEKVKKRIESIPSFTTDINKIDSISRVKINYGIPSNETIISFRVVPQLFARIEKGGTIFTDKGVYKRLPSGYLAFDFVTYGIKYEDMVNYIPFLGYSKKQQPQLVGEYTGKDTLSFWLTPVLDTDSNSEIVSIFSAIIQEIIEQDYFLKKTYEETKTKCLTILENRFEEGNISSKDEDILKMLIENNQFCDQQKEDAIFLWFKIKFASRDYSAAYNFVENNSNYMEEESFVRRIDPVIRNKIETIGIPETHNGVEALKLYCVKNHTYISLAFPNIVGYYYRNNEYDSADQFMEEFSNTPYYESMATILKGKIEETFSKKMDDWSHNPNSEADEKFVLYAMKHSFFYEKASQEFIKHYCVLGQFDDARKSLEKVRAVNENDEFLEELKALIQEYEIAYAEDQYKKAQRYIKSDNKELAIPYLMEALNHNLKKQEYMLCIIQVAMDLGKYSDARTLLSFCKKTHYKFDEESSTKIHGLELDCTKAMNKEMGILYDQLVEGNNEALLENYKMVQKVDQLGLSFYHYAILLQKNKIVSKIDVSETPVQDDICGFGLLEFGASARIVTPTFVTLLKLYDDDAKKLYKDYKKEKAKNAAKGVVDMFLDTAISGASRVDAKLQQMTDYDDDEMSNKRNELEDFKNKAQEARSSLGAVSWSDLDKEYNAEFSELADEKVNIYADKLEENVLNEDFESKLVYMVIKNPKLLDEIFHSSPDNFVLYEDEKNFWYLPQSLISKVKEVTI